MQLLNGNIDRYASEKSVLWIESITGQAKHWWHSPRIILVNDVKMFYRLHLDKQDSRSYVSSEEGCQSHTQKRILFHTQERGESNRIHHRAESTHREHTSKGNEVISPQSVSPMEFTKEHLLMVNDRRRHTPKWNAVIFKPFYSLYTFNNPRSNHLSRLRSLSLCCCSFFVLSFFVLLIQLWNFASSNITQEDLYEWVGSCNKSMMITLKPWDNNLKPCIYTGIQRHKKKSCKLDHFCESHSDSSDFFF